jgi:hypothetical protein
MHRFPERVCARITAGFRYSFERSSGRANAFAGEADIEAYEQ